ncbi:Small secreted domain [Streptomyces sp. TLI_053]|uniref:chaplin n=1 Tax=Streptomyces sp. TLI_053 TaxID=1855352 RepID=UPI00087CD2E5|nr:chaplin [Streptomyces sp. TLI_053]SDT83282.1 Small secreted domain [Streptomyces sp. TLI_053]
MTDPAQVRNTTRTPGRRRVRLGIAALVVASLPLAALGPARAADQAPSAAALARVSSVASELAAMGLQVRTRAGMIAAWGPADIVNAAVAQFADENPVAMFTELDQMGEGYVLFRGTNGSPFVGLTPGSGVAIRSVSNESDEEVVVYDYNTGHLNVAEDHHAAENLPDPHAASGKANRAGSTHGALVYSGRDILSGNRVQIPVHIPLNVCGSPLNFVATLNPATGTSCLGD